MLLIAAGGGLNKLNSNVVAGYDISVMGGRFQLFPIAIS